MTKNFVTIALEILEILREENNYPDVLLMARLGFTPDNWRHWRSKFIELFELQTYSKTDSDGKDRIVYDKKQKLWIIQDE